METFDFRMVDLRKCPKRANGPACGLKKKVNRKVVIDKYQIEGPLSSVASSCPTTSP